MHTTSNMARWNNTENRTEDRTSWWNNTEIKTEDRVVSA